MAKPHSPVDWSGRDKVTIILRLSEKPVSDGDAGTVYKPILSPVHGSGSLLTCTDVDYVFKVVSPHAELLEGASWHVMEHRGRTRRGVFVDAKDGFETELSPDGGYCALRVNAEINLFTINYVVGFQLADGRVAWFDPGTGNGSQPDEPSYPPAGPT